MRIPKKHEHTLHYIHEMGLGDKLRKFTTVFEEHNAFLNMDGEIVSIKDAPRMLMKRQQGVFQDTRYSEQTRFFAAWFKTIIDTIAPGSIREALAQDLESHLMDCLERLDLEPFFNEDGETINLHAFIEANPAFRAACNQALDVFLDDILIETSQDLLQIEGGTEQIIHRLASAIKGEIKCNQKVVAIRVREDGTEISWLENGELHTKLCEYVLCTIPFSVLRKMELSGFDDRKLHSINHTVYCPATKVAFHTDRSFWQDKGIKGGASFSGGGTRQTYYPSVDFKATNNESAFLASYTIGDDADVLANMPDTQRHDYVKNNVSQLHPELNQSGTIKNMTSIAWGNYEWSAGGCTIHWDGNYSNYLEAAKPQNQLFFAGEHCSRFPAWLQGSIESTLEAIYEIISHTPQPKLQPQFITQSSSKTLAYSVH
jgi:monoamine oxidase